MNWQLIEDDCLKILRGMNADTLDSVVCDPPYNLSFLGRSWDSHDTPLAFQKWCQSWAEECLRVLKPGGYLLAFGSPRTSHRLSVGIEDAGFEVRDAIAWIRAEGFPHSRNLPGGLGTNLKPSVEPITMARKPLEGNVAENHAEYGTGVLNIDACRIDANDKAKFPVGDYGDRGLYGANGDRTDDPNPDARWPSNLALDEEAAARLGESSRFFFCPKANAAEKRAGLDPERIFHPTTKPIDLMRWLVTMVTPPGGVCCDPFAGSGTTGIAANLAGFSFIGIEREAEYAEIARQRLEWWAAQKGDTADILKRAGLAVKEASRHAERGQLAIEVEP